MRFLNWSKRQRKKEFSCEADALKEIAALEKSLKNRIWTVACSLVTKDVEIEKRSVGRPPKNAKPVSKTTVWMIDAGELIVRQERYDLMRWKHESFVLITNVTEEHASAIEILRLYKEQKTVEDNFSVLKTTGNGGYALSENTEEDRCVDHIVVVCTSYSGDHPGTGSEKSRCNGRETRD